MVLMSINTLLGNFNTVTNLIAKGRILKRKKSQISSGMKVKKKKKNNNNKKN
jgi:hypothetical protein